MNHDRTNRRVYPLPGMSDRSVSEPVRKIPNALTVLRFIAIPVFVWLLFQDEEGPSWAAGAVFGLAAIISLALWCALGQLLARLISASWQWRAVNLLSAFLLAASIFPMWLP